MQRTVALFETKYGTITELGCSKEETSRYESSTWAEYTRVTEFVLIDFPDLPKAEIVNRKIAALDSVMDQVKTEATQKLQELGQRRQELLAITMDVSDESTTVD